jgi:primosomal protein N' (replication factor Y)
MAARAGALLVLGSATPDVKTFHAAPGRRGQGGLSTRVGAGPAAVNCGPAVPSAAEGPFAAVTAGHARPVAAGSA